MTVGKEIEDEGGPGRSPAYPAQPLPKCLAGVQALYDKDRFAAMPLETVARHLGYNGLNGASRPAVSALRQFGLIAYKESGKGTKATVTELAKRILLPKDDGEKNESIAQAFASCKIFDRVLSEFPDRHLPSDDTLRNLLIREFSFTEHAAKSFIASLRASLAFVASLQLPSEPPSEGLTGEESSEAPLKEQEPFEERATFGAVHRLSMPGTDFYLALPRDLDPRTARRMERWVKAVVLPALQFAATDDEEED